MKITIEHISSGENEIILRCRQLDTDMQKILACLKGAIERIFVQKGW